MSCIFCMIASGEIPSNKIFENEHVLAFHDVSPQAPVHALIIPKRHYASVVDDVPVELLGEVFAAVEHVADTLGIKDKGFRTIVNTGVDGGQTVFHLHVHVLGGAPMGERMVHLAAGE